jgi:hypothetical protein
MAKSAPPKRTQLRILKVRRSRRSITIDYKNGDEQHTITSRDNPLPSFGKALDALPPLVCELLGLPASYVENMKSNGLTFTDGENEQVTIIAAKSLSDANSPFNIATPLRFLDLPKKEGSFTPALTDKQVDLVREVEEQAKEYVRGNRAQGQIVFEGEDEEDEPETPAADPAQSTLPLPEGDTGKPARRAKRTTSGVARGAK